MVGFEEIVDDDEVGVFFLGELSDFFGFAAAEKGFGGGATAFLEDSYDNDTAVGLDEVREFAEIPELLLFVGGFGDDVDEDGAVGHGKFRESCHSRESGNLLYY